MYYMVSALLLTSFTAVNAELSPREK